MKLSYVQCHLADELHPEFKSGVRRFLVWTGRTRAHLFSPFTLTYKRIPLVGKVVHGKTIETGLDTLEPQALAFDAAKLKALIKKRAEQFERLDMKVCAATVKALTLLEAAA